MRLHARALSASLSAFLLLLIAGCANPVVGTWKANVGQANSTLTLEKDGKGKLEGQMGAAQQNVPLSWTEKDGTVTINLDLSGQTLPPGATVPALTATLSEDKKTLSLGAGGAQTLAFQKQ